MPGNVKAEVSHYRELVQDFDWLEDYLKSEWLKAELNGVLQECAELNKLIQSRADFIEELKKNFEDYTAERQRRLLVLIGGRSGREPNARFFSRLLASTGFSSIPPFVAWDEVLEAAERIQYEGGISDKERVARQAELNGKARELGAELTTLSGSWFFTFKDGQVNYDAREKLIQMWRSCQAEYKAAVDPEGYGLEDASDQVKQAWHRLNLRAFVNHKGADPEKWARRFLVVGTND